MLELQLQDLIRRTLYSLPFNVTATFHPHENNTLISIEDAFKHSEQIIFELYGQPLLEIKKIETLNTFYSQLRPVAALYTCFLLMEDVFHKTYPFGHCLNQAFIRNFYDCTTFQSVDIYNSIKRQIKDLEHILSFPDPKYINPKAVKIHNSEHMANIYSGHTLSYLKKVYENANNKYYTKDLSPSITFVALKAAGSLPNGGNTNKSFRNLSSNIIQAIDKPLQGGNIYSKECNIQTINLYKLQYHTSNNVSHLLNLAVFDDIYRLERLNYVLHKLLNHFDDKSAFNWHQQTEYAILKSYALYLSIPFPLFSTFDPLIKELIQGIISGNSLQVIKNAQVILTYISIIIPYYIGIFCTYYLCDKWENLKTTISELEKYLTYNYENLKNSLKSAEPRIWSVDYSKSPNSHTYSYQRNKGNTLHPKQTQFICWKEKHQFSFNETLGLLLNQADNIISTRTLMDENYCRMQTRFFHRDLPKSKITLEQLESILGDSTPVNALDYVKTLTSFFLSELRNEVPGSGVPLK